MKLQAIKYKQGILWVSDEEIKEGDWCFFAFYNQISRADEYFVYIQKTGAKKIIAQSNLSLEHIPYIEIIKDTGYTNDGSDYKINPISCELEMKFISTKYDLINSNIPDILEYYNTYINSQGKLCLKVKNFNYE